MRSAAESVLQVLCMHQDADEIIFVKVQAEKHSASHVIDAALHGSVHGLRVVCVIALRAGRMQILVGFLVVCLLEKDICSDACFL